MQPTIVPMSLGDIFDRLFKLIGKTVLRNLMIAIVIFIPALIIFAYGMNDFFSVIAQTIRAEELNFGRSSFLVKDYWWRTFGIILLLNIIVQFAISIVTTPIQFIAFWRFFSKYFTMISSISEGTADSM